MYDWGIITRFINTSIKNSVMTTAHNTTMWNTTQQCEKISNLQVLKVCFKEENKSVGFCCRPLQTSFIFFQFRRAGLIYWLHSISVLLLIETQIIMTEIIGFLIEGCYSYHWCPLVRCTINSFAAPSFLGYIWKLSFHFHFLSITAIRHNSSIYLI